MSPARLWRLAAVIERRHRDSFDRIATAVGAAGWAGVLALVLLP